MRRFLCFSCDGDHLAATLDESHGTTGLLIVSGGNEIRSGGHANQARLAAWAAGKGHPVFRYDRPGIGDSAGTNRGYLEGGPALRAAVTAFRDACPSLDRIVAFGNCDAAALLIHSAGDLDIDALLLANPWLIEPFGTPDLADGAADGPSPMPSSAAIRARYLARLKNPVRLLRDLMGGAIDLRKFAAGLARLRARQAPSPLAARAAAALEALETPTTILIAQADATALTFMAAWKSPLFRKVQRNPRVRLTAHPTSSHSFSDASSQRWLREEILDSLQKV
ncbi:MAG: hydrolase 1, exosortase A system-associated [Novosphingopyxis baekryungensis]|nr:hydrolase 1, exosortase A system-associated [Novosphingopyxis baekryungensis]